MDDSAGEARLLAGGLAPAETHAHPCREGPAPAESRTHPCIEGPATSRTSDVGLGEHKEGRLGKAARRGVGPLFAARVRSCAASASGSGALPGWPARGLGERSSTLAWRSGGRLAASASGCGRARGKRKKFRCCHMGPTS